MDIWIILFSNPTQCLSFFKINHFGAISMQESKIFKVILFQYKK